MGVIFLQIKHLIVNEKRDVSVLRVFGMFFSLEMVSKVVTGTRIIFSKLPNSQPAIPTNLFSSVTVIMDYVLQFIRILQTERSLNY